MSSTGIEPEIPAIKQLKNYALGRTATGIGVNSHYYQQ
jgi:fumarate hydratase class II